MQNAIEQNEEGVTRFQSFERLRIDGKNFWIFHDDLGLLDVTENSEEGGDVEPEE